MLDFLRNRNRVKLYNQWIERDGLSPDDMPPDLKKSKNDTMEGNSIFENEAEQAGYQGKQIQRGDTVFLGFRVKYIYVMGFIIAILLIAVSITLTILIMQAC